MWTFELKILGSNSWLPDDLETLMNLIQEGKLKPVIDTVLPLDQTAEGVRQLEEREVIGKIIITPKARSTIRRRRWRPGSGPVRPPACRRW